MLGALALLVWGGLAWSGSTLPIDDFEGGLRPGWEEKVFSGRTLYRVVAEADGNRVLRAESRGSASGLVYRIAFDPHEFPILTWRWKVEHVLARGDATRKDGDDYPARVYVVFPHWFPPKSRALNYIWANRLPKGRAVPNPFWGRNVMIAVESGPEDTGRWIVERRDLVEDYRRIFGADPPRAGAVAVMTDTDQTGEAAVAFYDDVRLETR
ncbi:MAG: DUF3047 domain-containing protein [Deferrisomatales bacterium]